MTITESEFKEVFSDPESDAVRTLARNGLGSLYAEEVIKRANEITELDKNTPNDELTEKQIEGLYSGFKDLFDNLTEGRIKPQIVKDETKEDVVALDLINNENFEKTYFESFNEE